MPRKVTVKNFTLKPGYSEKDVNKVSKKTEKIVRKGVVAVVKF